MPVFHFAQWVTLWAALWMHAPVYTPKLVHPLLFQRIANYGQNAASTPAGPTWPIQLLTPASNVVVGSTASNQSQAMLFTVNGSGGAHVTDITMVLWKQGSPADNYEYQLYGVTSSKPGTLLGTTNTAAGSGLNTTPGTTHNLAFASPIAVTGGTQYFVAIARTGAVNASNYYLSYYNASGNGRSTYNGSVWGSASGTGMMYYVINGTTP